MIYLDTSYIVKCYVAEPGSDRILAWLEGQRGIVCSWQGRLEFFSAIHRHVQAGNLNVTRAKRVTSQLESDEAQGIWTWLPVTLALVRRTCQTVGGLGPKTCLRAADALHLATAADAGCACIYSHDRHLLGAAKVFGVEARDILE